MPKPPPLQSIFESTGGSSASSSIQQGVGVAMGVAGASQGTVVSYSVQPTATAVAIGNGGGTRDQRQQIMANVSSVNVMVPAATPTFQVTQQQQQDASNVSQTVGGKKKVRDTKS